MLKNESVTLHDSSDNLEFLHDVLTGLSRKQKWLSSKYFYDEAGSRLFDQICDLDEYYITRTEVELMDRYAPEMAEAIGGESVLVELGSGSSRKTRLLLEEISKETVYIPVDISRDHLHDSAEQLAFDFPELTIHPIHADFTEPLERSVQYDSSRRRVVYFPGSTIGNFEPEAAPARQRPNRPATAGSTIGNFEPEAALKLLRSIAEFVQPDGALLIGYDLVKEHSILEDAYNDSMGVTAEFNKNVLKRINEELEADFNLEEFEHRATFNPDKSRIEMHLVSQRKQTVTINGEAFEFRPGESICTEYSHKYSQDKFRQLAARAGFVEEKTWTDPNQYFAVSYFRARN